MFDSRTAPYAAFILRIALGAMFIAHALRKYCIRAGAARRRALRACKPPGATQSNGSTGMKTMLTLLSIAVLMSVAYGATELTEQVCLPPAVAQAWS